MPHAHPRRPARFPFFAGRVYTPELASPEEMAALHQALHIKRVVIVTPSVYGTDNSATLFGMKARGADARGVAVIDDKTPESELDAMARAGMRGIRLNLATGGASDPDVGRQRFQAAVERMKSRGWHIQMYTNLAGDLRHQGPGRWRRRCRSCSIISAAPRRRSALGAAGLCRSGRAGAVRQGLRQDFRRLSRLQASAGLSGCGAAREGADRGQRGAHRLGHRLAASQLATPPGSKPTEVTPLLQIDDGRLLNQLAVWAPDAATRKTILVDNPARLYGF